MADDGAQVVFLVGSAAADDAAAGFDRHFIAQAGLGVGLGQLGHARLLQVQVNHFRRQHLALRKGVEVHQQASRRARGRLAALDGEQVAAAEYFHAEAGFDLLEMAIELATQVGQPQRIGRLQFQRHAVAHAASVTTRPRRELLSASVISTSIK